MLFVAIWSSFALSLFLLNRQKHRQTFDEIPGLCAWKVAVLLGTGFVGGFALPNLTYRNQVFVVPSPAPASTSAPSPSSHCSSVSPKR